MSQLTQPIAAAPTEAALKPVKSATAGHAPTFAELVYAHFDWWRACRRDGADAATTAAYHHTLAAFERRHGEIVSAYWCSRVESAVALTHKKRAFPWGARSPRCTVRATGPRRMRLTSRASSTAATSWRCGPGRCSPACVS